MLNKWTRFGLKLCLYFIFIVSTTMPFQFNLIKFNTFFAPFLESFYQKLGVLLFPKVSSDWLFISDSMALYFHIFLVFCLSVLLSLIPIPSRFTNKKLSAILITYCRYYLSLMLIIYGFNKVFKWQFFDPHPNTVFTPVGQLSKDFLYWTSMGTSVWYNRIIGLVEVLIGMSLWFRSTQVVGSMLALLALAHIVLINFAFDINVKVQSLFLLLVSAILIFPYLSSIIQFLRNKSTKLPNIQIERTKWMRVAKIVIILFILIEGIYPYYKNKNWNGDNRLKPPFYGAYEIKNSEEYRRFFIHSDPYFIIQTNEDMFYSFQMKLFSNQLIVNQNKQESILNYSNENQTLTISGNLFGEEIHWVAEAIPFEQLPIFEDNFHWTIEQISN